MGRPRGIVNERTDLLLTRWQRMAGTVTQEVFCENEGIRLRAFRQMLRRARHRKDRRAVTYVVGPHDRHIIRAGRG